ARVHPTASVSISSEVLPEYREYERTVTTLVDAFVKPRVARYVSQIETRLRDEVGPTTPFYIMKSNGGVVSAREVAGQPIGTLLSGPAAGAAAASRRLPTPHSCSGEFHRTCSAARFRSTCTSLIKASASWPRRSGSAPSAPRQACSRSPPGTRPTPCARSRSDAGWTCATTCWSRSAARG